MVRPLVASQPDDCVAGMHLPAKNAAHRDSPDVVVVIDVGNEHLEGTVVVARRLGDMFHDRIHERLEVCARHGQVGRGRSGATDGIEHRKVELMILAADVDKK